MMIFTFSKPLSVQTQVEPGSTKVMQQVSAVTGTWKNSPGTDGKISVTAVMPVNQDNMIACQTFTLDTVMNANAGGIVAIQE